MSEKYDSVKVTVNEKLLRKLENGERAKAIQWIEENFGLVIGEDKDIFVNRDKNEGQAFKLLDDFGIVERVFGHYVGDGEESQAIAGVGFYPSGVMVQTEDAGKRLKTIWKCPYCDETSLSKEEIDRHISEHSFVKIKIPSRRE